MNIQKALINEYKRHFDSLESIKNEYIDTYRTISDGIQFEYEGEICTVVGATFVFDPDIAEISIIDVNEMIDFLQFTKFVPDRTIWYLIDIPKFRITDKPDLKVTWSQAMLNKVLN